MCLCHFCKREFENSQGLKAHLRRCRLYQQSKNGPARPTAPIPPFGPNAVSSPHSFLAPNPLTTPSALFTNLMDEMIRSVSGPDEATRRREKREALLAGLCSRIVDWYRQPDGLVTPEMAVAAKVAIRDQLGALPIEELSHAELSLRGEAIRNGVFGPYLRRQQAHAEHQKQRQHHDGLRTKQEADRRARQMTRKTALLELGVIRALKVAAAHGLPAPAVALVEWEARARLEALLVGDETAEQVEEIIEAAIERPLLECEIRVERLRSAKRERILDQCLTLALPVAEAAWPWVKDTVLTKVCETFGLNPTPPAHLAHD
jgi:hypothetical protein